jgi:hypothetical protein
MSPSTRASRLSRFSASSNRCLGFALRQRRALFSALRAQLLDLASACLAQAWDARVLVPFARLCCVLRLLGRLYDLAGYASGALWSLVLAFRCSLQRALPLCLARSPMGSRLSPPCHCPPPPHPPTTAAICPGRGRAGPPAQRAASGSQVCCRATDMRCGTCHSQDKVTELLRRWI